MIFSKETMLLYAVTDSRWAKARSLYEQVESALKGGVTCVQLREKHLTPAALLKEALEIKALCHRYGVPMLINDNVEIALQCDADGVHVGQSDMDTVQARSILGPDKIIGVTARTPEQAKAAEAAGASYLGSGAVFGSTTKADAKALDLRVLQQICQSVNIPVVAIGGITAENLPLLSGTGVDGAALVSAIFSADDIEARCRELKQLSAQMVRG